MLFCSQQYADAQVDFKVVDVFMSQNMIQQATSFLLDALKENKPEQGHLQVGFTAHVNERQSIAPYRLVYSK